MEDLTNIKKDLESLEEDVELFRIKCSQGYGNEIKRGTVKRYESLSGIVAQINDKITVSRMLDGEKTDSFEFTLVELKTGGFDRSKVSLESPLGNGTIGKRIGETFTYSCKLGVYTVKIENIVVPEKEKEAPSTQKTK